jgi:preprotein translocase subunit YajC
MPTLLTILANADDDGTGGGAAIVQLGILLLIPLAMYFLMIRPQRKRMREQAALQSALEVGDEVLLTSGMYGFITGFDDEQGIAWVEVDDDVQLRVLRSSITGKVDTSGGVAAPSKDSSGASSATSTKDGGADKDTTAASDPE